MHASVILSHAAALLGKTSESRDSVLATGCEWPVNLSSLESTDDQRWWLWHSPEHILLIFQREAEHARREGVAVFSPL